MDLRNLPGTGDFSPPDPECQLAKAEEYEELDVDWCGEHDQPWSDCGGQTFEEDF
jgi:hypothetical protein